MTDQTAAEDVASTLELLAEPTRKHGKWILGQLAQQVRALADELTAAQAAIQRVRELATTEAVLDHSRGWVVLAGAVLCALDGDTTEEQR